LCLLYCFFSACDENNRTDIEVAVELLEDNGFHVSDAREERAKKTETGHVIDDNGTVDTGAILLRIVPGNEGAA
jgi:beta-lactam-binding protein with PASTA domain